MLYFAIEMRDLWIEALRFRKQIGELAEGDNSWEGSPREKEG